MNFARFNGGMFNSARVATALALVACTSTAQVNAAATYIYRANSAVAATVTIAAKPFSHLFGDSSAFLGTSNVIGRACHTHSLFSDVVGTVSCLAYSISQVYSQGELGGIAEATFIPASALAFVDAAGSSSVYGEATKTQPGYTSIVATASVDPGDPVAYRMVLCNINTTAQWRIESGVNKVFDTYGDPTAISGVVIDDAGLVTKQVGALIYGVAYVTPQGTQTSNGQAAVVAQGSAVSSAILNKAAQTHLAGSGSFSAWAEYRSQAKACVVGEGILLDHTAYQKHATAGQVVTGAAITDTAIAVRMPKADALASAECSYEATYWFSGQAIPIGTVDISAVAKVTHFWFGESVILASGGLSPIGYENLMAPMDPTRIFTRPETLREFERSESSRVFWK